MECTQIQQIIPDYELIPSTAEDPIKDPKQIEVYDEKSAEFRRYLASEKAIRELEQRRDLSLIAAHRMSFIR